MNENATPPPAIPPQDGTTPQPSPPPVAPVVPTQQSPQSIYPQPMAPILASSLPKPELSLQTIFGSIGYFAVVSFILGLIFGEGVFLPVSAWAIIILSYLGYKVIGLGLLLFIPAIKRIHFWFVYPFLGYLFTSAVISQSTTEQYYQLGLNIQAIAMLALFGAFVFIFALISITSILLGKYAKQLNTIAILVVLLFVPAVIQEIPRIFAPKPVTYGPPRKPHLPDTIGSKSDIVYMKYFEDAVYTSNGENVHSARYVVDIISSDEVPKQMRGSACKSFKDGSETNVVKYVQHVTPGKHTFGSHEKRDENRITTSYCFYDEPYEYQISRTIPLSNNQKPNAAIVKKAYQAYPIERVIDSYFTE